MVDGREEEEREERVCREGLGEVGRKHAGKQQQPRYWCMRSWLFHSYSPADQPQLVQSLVGLTVASVAGVSFVPEARDGLGCVETKQSWIPAMILPMSKDS